MNYKLVKSKFVAIGVLTAFKCLEAAGSWGRVDSGALWKEIKSEKVLDRGALCRDLEYEND